MTKGVSGFIYAVGVDWTGPIKIGVAVDTVRRLERLQSGNHLTLQLLWQSDLLEDPFSTEAQLHQAFAEHRVRGEWFQIPDISGERLAETVAAARKVPRRREPDEPTAAAVKACRFLLDKLVHEQRLSLEDAIGRLASASGVGRSTIWSLRYRPPKEITTAPYANIVAELWRATGRPPFGIETMPLPEDVQAALRGEPVAARSASPDLEKLTALTDKLEAALGIAPSRTGTEG